MFAEGLMLMVLGMSVVFLFLGLLVLTIKATSFVLRKFIGNGPEENPPAARASVPAKKDKAAIAAIVASVIDRSQGNLREGG